MKLRLAFLSLFLIAAAPVGVRQQTSGAFVMGSPSAKVRLVEYLSYSCSHCAHFTGEAATPLKRDYVAKGLVNVEVRNAVRDRFDFAAALLARCGGPARFFGNTEALMASQSEWLGKASAFETASGDKLTKSTINQSLILIAHGVGLDGVMKKRGFTAPQINACLINKTAQDKITAMTNEAWNVRRITGTPSFLINDVGITAVGTWDQMEPLLKTALAITKSE